MRIKNLLPVSLLIAGSLTAGAERVSAVRAREIATAVLPAVASGSPLRAPGLDRDDDTPYYVFNAPSSGGYVIVAGDDRLPAVLGYSLDGNLDLDNAPEALTFLLEMSASMPEPRGGEYAPTGAGVPVVEPLLGDTNWGQSDPFNALCPMLSSSQRGYVGCVATAMAQIMRYHGYPAQGTGVYSYVHGNTTLSADFGATTYDWDNMPAVVPDNVSERQRTAYSTLCAHLGIAVEMQYAANGSGAYTMMVAPALRDHFGYSPSMRMHSRSYYNTAEWMAMIKAELDARRPVYYAASSEDGLGGHAFVCDGYDSEEFVHINWGWYGGSNGYFYINHLNPGELGTGGGGGAYNIDQEIITDFMPAAAGDKAWQPIYGATRFTCDSFGTDMTFMSYIENLDTKPFDGEILAVLVDGSGQIAAELKSETQAIEGFKSGRSGALLMTMRNIPTTVGKSVADGDYRLNFAYRTAEMEEPLIMRHPIGLPGYANCQVRGGLIMLTTKHEPKPVVRMTTPIASNGDLHAGGGTRLAVTLSNDSEDFRLSTNILTLTSTADPDVAYQKEYLVNIYERSSAEVIMDVDLPEEIAPGRYKLTLAHKGHLDKPYASVDNSDIYIDVLPEAQSPIIRLTGSPVWQSNGADPSRYLHGDMLLMALPAKNFGSEGTTQVICRLMGDDGTSTVLHAYENNWSRNQAATVTLSNYITVKPGRYTPAFFYLDENGAEKPVALTSPLDGIYVEANPDLAAEVTAFEMPDRIARGESVNGSITVKGLAASRGTLYIRVRRFTNNGGEIAYMKSNLSLTPGEEQTLTFKYKPGVDDGRYLVLVEFKEGSQSKPAGGQDVYYREIAIGDVGPAGVDNVAADSSEPTRWYNLQGLEVTPPSSPGIYIKSTGTRTEKVYMK